MKKRQLIIYSALLAAGMLLLASCSRDNLEPEPGIVPQEFNYELALPDATDKSGLIMKELGAEVVSVEGTPDWLEISAETDDKGTPTLWVSYNEVGKVSRREATLTVTAQNGNKGIVSVFQVGESLGDGALGANTDEWLTNWERFDKVDLYGMAAPQYTPWNDNAETPADIDMFKGLTKANGWEMAFSYLNDENAADRRYFGLYNRWLGILRVFCYVKNPGLANSELVFDVTMGTSNGNRYPFYNALSYAIPTSHSPQKGNLSLTTDLLGYGQAVTFKDLIAPYTRSVSSAMSKGWNVFDIDMTGFVPAGSPWMEDPVSNRLNINGVGRITQNITLAGTIAANIQGTQTDQEVLQHGGASAQSGVVGVLNKLTSIAGGIKSAGNFAKEQMDITKYRETNPDWLHSSYLNFATGVGYFSVGAKIASGVLDWMTSHETSVEYETIPGKIDLTMNGTIDLSGAITSWGSTGDVGSLNVVKGVIAGVNRAEDGSEGHMGSGIVSLAEDPVIYVVKDAVLADVDHFNLSVQGKGVYSNAGIEEDYVRLIAFIDPTSIKLNLNTELYNNKIKEVLVDFNYCVFPTAPYGNTEPMRQVLGLDRPSVDLSMGKSSGLNRFTKNSSIHVYKYTAEDVLKGGYIYSRETPENSAIYEQAGVPGGAHLRYYGMMSKIAGKQFIAFPQVYVPYVKSGNTGSLTDGLIPDYVVCVYITFEVDGKPFTFTLQYLPEIRLITLAEAQTIFSRMNKWALDYDSYYYTGTLENDHSVPVAFPYAPTETMKERMMLYNIINLLSK